MAAKNEIEVFKIDRFSFDKTKCYEYALATRMNYDNHKNLKYYTSIPLKYVGQFVRYDYEDGYYGICEIYFDDNGKETKIEVDYDGKTCFREM